MSTELKTVAWMTFDGEGGYDYRSFEDNEQYRDDFMSRNGPGYASWVQPLVLRSEAEAEIARLADAYRAELDTLSTRNYELRMQFAALEASKQEEQSDSYESIWNALQRIDTVAAMLPTYTVDHEGGIEAFTQNIVDAIQRLAVGKQEAQGGQVPDEEPLCHECEGSGIVQAVTSHLGPDDYEYEAQCDVCNGTGSPLLLDQIAAMPYRHHTPIGSSVAMQVMRRDEVLRLVEKHQKAALAATPATPAQAERVALKPLTEQEAEEIWTLCWNDCRPGGDEQLRRQFAHAVIAKFCELNGIGTSATKEGV